MVIGKISSVIDILEVGAQYSVFYSSAIKISNGVVAVCGGGS